MSLEALSPLLIAALILLLLWGETIFAAYALWHFWQSEIAQGIIAMVAAIFIATAKLMARLLQRLASDN